MHKNLNESSKYPPHAELRRGLDGQGWGPFDMAALLAARALRQLAAGSTVRPPCVERAPSGKAGGKQAKQKEGGRKVHERYVKMFEAKGAPSYERSPEEKTNDAEIAKEYTRQMFARHNLWSRRITMRIKLRDAAIASLPEDLQAEAMQMDMEPAPRNRHIFTEFPPLKGYQGQ